MKKRAEQYLAQFVYGAIDGSVTTFAVVAGAAGAQLPSVVIIILGLANLIADGFSMGASAYLSSKSDRDLRKKNLAKIEYSKTPLKIGLSTFFAFVAVGFVPLGVYVGDAVFSLQLESQGMFVASSLLTAIAFLSIGFLKGVVTKTSLIKASIETLALGGVAAGLAYGLGSVLAIALGTA